MTTQAQTTQTHEATKTQENSMTSTTIPTSKLDATTSRAMMLTAMLPDSLTRGLAWGAEHDDMGLVLVTETEQLANYLDSYIRGPYQIVQEEEHFLIPLDEDCDEYEMVKLGDLRRLEHAQIHFLKNGEIIRTDRGSDDFRHYTFFQDKDDAGDDADPIWADPKCAGEPCGYFTDK